MGRPRMFVIGLLCLAIFVCGLVFSQAGGSTTPAPAVGDETVRTLLDEVRQLRLTLQKANFNGHRAQLIVERIRTQQEHVGRLTNRLEELRNEISNLQFDLPAQTEHMRELETRIRQEPDSERRMQMESQLQDLKNSTMEQRQRADRLRDREAQLSAQLRDEQAALDGLRDKADAIGRELEREMENPGTSQKRPDDGNHD